MRLPSPFGTAETQKSTGSLRAGSRAFFCELILQNVVDDGKRIQGPREAEEGKTHFERIDQVLLHGAYCDVPVHMGAHLRFAAAERDD